MVGRVPFARSETPGAGLFCSELLEANVDNSKGNNVSGKDTVENKELYLLFEGAFAEAGETRAC